MGISGVPTPCGHPNCTPAVCSHQRAVGGKFSVVRRDTKNRQLPVAEVINFLQNRIDKDGLSDAVKEQLTIIIKTLARKDKDFNDKQQENTSSSKGIVSKFLSKLKQTRQTPIELANHVYTSICDLLTAFETAKVKVKSNITDEEKADEIHKFNTIKFTEINKDNIIDSNAIKNALTHLIDVIEINDGEAEQNLPQASNPK